MKAKWIPTPLVAAREKPPLPVRELSRHTRLRIFYLLLKLLVLPLRLTWLRLSSGASSKDLASYVRTFLEDLGGVWIKVGQVLSLRSDLFSIAFCNELSKLQDRADAFSPELARQRIEEELGLEISEAFDCFVPHPVAAASLSQVHKARLRRNGAWVAVKVQKPNVEQLTRYDFGWIGRLMRLLEFFAVLPRFHWSEMHYELNLMIKEELDYRYEASALRRMRRSLCKHKIYIPKVFRRYCGKRILTMEFLDGVLMSDYLQSHRTDPRRLERWLEENDIRRERVARQLIHSLSRQMYEDNLFHGDLHPGNVMLLRGSRIALIDLGSVGSSDVDFMEQYDDSMFAIASKRYTMAADLSLLLAGKIPAEEIYQIRKELVRSMRASAARAVVRDLDFHEKSISSYFEQLNQVYLKYKFESNWAMLKIMRAWATLDMSIGALYPEIDYMQTLRGYYKAAHKRKSPQSLSALSDLPGQLRRLSTFTAPVLRERALYLLDTHDKSHLVSAFLLRLVSAAGWVGLAAVGWWWVFPSGRFAATFAGVLESVGLPSLVAGPWVVIFLGLGVFLNLRLRKLAGILSSPRVRGVSRS